MEALAAVGLAGAIVQFIDFSAKLVSAAKQIRDHGDTAENVQTSALSYRTKELMSNMRTATNARLLDPVLDTLCKECEDIAQELIAALDKLDVKGSQGLRTIFKALKTLWGKEKIVNIEQKLNGYRSQLILHVTVTLEIQVNALRFEQSDGLDSLEDSMKSSCHAILDAIDLSESALGHQIQEQGKAFQKIHEKAQKVNSSQFAETKAAITKEHEETRLAIAFEMDDLKSCQERSARDTLVEISDDIHAEGTLTRTDVAKNLQINHEETKLQVAVLEQQINDLRKDLQILLTEQERSNRELRNIILQTAGTNNETQRAHLQKKGNTIVTTIIALKSLSDELLRLLAGMLQQAKVLFDAPKLRSVFNWSADLESDKNSATRFSKIKIAAFLRMDFPVCSTSDLNALLSLQGGDQVFFDRSKSDIICQEIKTLLIYYETYYQPLINVTDLSAGWLGRRHQIEVHKFGEINQLDYLKYTRAHAELQRMLDLLYKTPFIRTMLLLRALCTCFNIPLEYRRIIWTSTFNLLHKHYLAINTNVLRLMKAVDNVVAPSNGKSFFSGRFDRGTNAGNRLESDVELCARLADLSGLTRVAAHEKRLAMLNAEIPSDSITWMFGTDEIQLTCILVVLLRCPTQPLYIDSTCTTKYTPGQVRINSSFIFVQEFLFYADRHEGGVRLMIDRNRPSFWMCKVLAAFGVDFGLWKASEGIIQCAGLCVLRCREWARSFHSGRTAT